VGIIGLKIASVYISTRMTEVKNMRVLIPIWLLNDKPLISLAVIIKILFEVVKFKVRKSAKLQDEN